MLCLFALGMVVTASSFAAPTWYTVKVTQIVLRSASGDVFVQFNPGASEARFTQTARGVLLGGDAGTNKVMTVSKRIPVQIQIKQTLTEIRSLMGWICHPVATPWWRTGR